MTAWFCAAAATCVWAIHQPLLYPSTHAWEGLGLRLSSWPACQRTHTYTLRLLYIGLKPRIFTLIFIFEYNRSGTKSTLASSLIASLLIYTIHVYITCNMVHVYSKVNRGNSVLFLNFIFTNYTNFYNLLYFFHRGFESLQLSKSQLSEPSDNWGCTVLRIIERIEVNKIAQETLIFWE